MRPTHLIQAEKPSASIEFDIYDCAYMYSGNSSKLANPISAATSSFAAADPGALTASAISVPPELLVDGSIDEPGEFDVFSFEVVAGETYMLSVYGSGGTPLEDSVLYLADDTFTILNLDDDGGSGRNSLLTFTAAYTGTYYAGSSCGLCGIENLEQALRPLPAVPAPAKIAPAAIFRALEAIGGHQPINAATGAVHAAAWCDAMGEVLAAREDVGRHNAFDKLVGHMMREGRDPSAGFALLTARCSYELVEKAALSGIPLLATISAPTGLAVQRAVEAGLTLVALARPDSFLVMADPHALFGSA